MKSDIRPISVEPYFIPLKARTPLKFGAVVVESVTYCQVKATVETKGRARATGWGGILLMDFWGWPSPSVPHEKRDEVMRKIVQRYAKKVEAYGNYAHPVDLFFDLEKDLRRINTDHCRRAKVAEEQPFLGALICACPIDAALHDAFGKANKMSTYEGYSADFTAHDLSRYLGPRFKGKFIGDYVRKDYARELPVFHLVGGLDKLRRREVDESDPQDGLPNSLEEWVERDGLICLKIKLRGNDLDWDVGRIKEVVAIAHEVQSRQGRAELCFSADTNEQCETPQYIVEMLRRLKHEAPRAYRELLYVEQPTERDLTAHRFDMRALGKMKPVIVDESLTSVADFDLALELGWTGVALKSCKCQSGALVLAAKAEEAKVPYTVQDLTNPALALIHSVGLAARLNPMMGVEANARQFFPAASEPEAAVHPNLFHLRNGKATTESLTGWGLGYQIQRIDRKL